MSTQESYKQSESSYETAPRDPHVGKIANQKWKLGPRLGKGGAGIVYACEQIATGQSAAIKLLRSEWEEDSETLERFFLEVQILRRLRHPHIVEIYDVGFQEELGFFLVMERLHGQDLRSRVEASEVPLPWNEVATIIGQICEAMAFAHDKGVIHRDLKPANIFLVEVPHQMPKVKLLDFGIAKAQTHDDAQITQTGMMVGSPAYLAPEQALGQPIDARSDLYSLSVILFELLTQKSLFQQDNSFQYMLRHVYATPLKISQARPDIRFPQALEDLIWEGLAKEASQRPANMLQFQQRLLAAFESPLMLASSAPESELPGTYRLSQQAERPEQAYPQQPLVQQPLRLQLQDGSQTIPGSEPTIHPVTPRQTNLPMATPLPAKALAAAAASALDTPLPRRRPEQTGRHSSHENLTAPTTPKRSQSHSQAAIRSRGDLPAASNIPSSNRTMGMKADSKTASSHRSRQRTSAVWDQAHEEEQRKRRIYLAISFGAITLLLLFVAALIGK